MYRRCPSVDTPVRISCYVDSSKIRTQASGFEPCDWFAIRGTPGRMWGCHILTHRDGAFYREVPPHWIAFSEQPEPNWSPEQAQLWDCYGYDFGTIAYDRLNELDAYSKIVGQEYAGSYLFNAVPYADGFSEEPSQNKEFVFVRLDNGRLTIQPTNKVQFHCKSIAANRPAWPADLVPLNDVWRCE